LLDYCFFTIEFKKKGILVKDNFTLIIMAIAFALNKEINFVETILMKMDLIYIIIFI